MSRFFLSISAFLWFAILAAIILAGVAVIGGFASVPVKANGLQCFPRDELVRKLADSYGETVVQRGLSGDTMVELYASDSGSFTLVLTAPDGKACLILSGEAMEHLTSRPEGAPA